MERMLREYEENGIQMQEFEVTTDSGKTHVVRKPVPQEPTFEQLLEVLKQEYLKLIRDAKDLGDEEDVLRIQTEYRTKKQELEAEQIEGE
ncbi:hypothetical protein BHU72_12055 [Desulfuribacillus stibiiarsenatis]|uniref:Uncharacterized protein n=1 Tax=Desulfuribacillus stibiiarsenatis TaxID=1390249 RepID=A0A1E5L7Z5_9FIRM|nr:hypothetical protein [Desulfuribacillus stibiiarsenatis]OEH86261.1 hypothetical protein BHU72_12055 [Desulfuribacillus stibiiarsenatis]